MLLCRSHRHHAAECMLPRALPVVRILGIALEKASEDALFLCRCCRQCGACKNVLGAGCFEAVSAVHLLQLPCCCQVLVLRQRLALNKLHVGANH